MRRFWLLVFIMSIIFLTRCIQPYEWDGLDKFDEIPDLGIQTIQDAMNWVAWNINWVSDAIHYPADEYWQSPAQTYVWRSGDCEDYCILVLYLIHRDVEIDGKMCVDFGYVLGSGGHAWVYVDGHYWEPQIAYMADGNPDYINPAAMIDYDELIERSTTTHKALRESE